jgi:ankyrin repeat protein
MFFLRQIQLQVRIPGLVLLTALLFAMPRRVEAQQNALLEAVRQNNIIALQQAIDQKININQFDDDSDHVLLNAALYASADCMSLLLKNSADPNVCNRQGETALMWCSHDITKASLLLQYGAHINTVSKSGNSVLLIACVGAGQQAMIQFLLKNGADPAVKNKQNETSLFRAAQFGDTAIAGLLLRTGIDMDAKTINNETALRAAVVNENREMVYWLLKNGADANRPDSYNALPLSYAVVLNDAAIVKAVAEKTTDINWQDIDGITALMWACYDEHDNPGIIQMLLDRGANPDIKDKKNRTPLTWALQNRNTQKSALLTKAGAY